MLDVILPVHNRCDITRRFLDDLLQQTVSDFRLVLIDDGCTDDTVAVARTMIDPDQLVILRGDGELWWGGALHDAYQHLSSSPGRSQAVLIVNDDVRLSPDFLERGLALLASRSNACIQAVGIEMQSRAIVRGVKFDPRRLSFRGAAAGELPDCLSTRGLLMSTPTFLASGGFVPRWLPHYLSDYEFTLRLHRHGVPLVCDDSFNLEFDGATTGESDPRDAPNSVRDFVRRAFSNRAKFNPLHWSALALRTCNTGLAIYHVARIWYGFVRRVAHISMARHHSSRSSK